MAYLLEQYLGQIYYNIPGCSGPHTSGPHSMDTLVCGPLLVQVDDFNLCDLLTVLTLFNSFNLAHLF